MKQFIGKLKLVNDTDLVWVLDSDYTYENDKYIITVKAGYKTDGASLPKATWSIFGSPLEAKLAKAGVIHDGLYSCGILSRKESDDLLKEMWSVDSVQTTQLALMYYAVRMFGSSRYGKDTKDQIDLVEVKLKSKGI